LPASFICEGFSDVIGKPILLVMSAQVLFDLLPQGIDIQVCG
jgi:hypothetical protein